MHTSFASVIEMYKGKKTLRARVGGGGGGGGGG